MLTNWILILYILAILALITVAIISVFKGSTTSNWLPMIISVLALTVTVLSSFRAEFLPSNVQLICTDVLMAPTKPPPTDKALLLLAFPISFLNNGYGDDIVESVATLATDEAGTIKFLQPKFEINFETFIHGKKYLHAENIMGPFSSFQLQSKTSAKHTILFCQEYNKQRYKITEWTPGTYRFDFYVKLATKSSPQLLLTMKFKLDTLIMGEYFEGKATHMSNMNFDI